MGDPAGVGPLIAWRAWQERHVSPRPFYVIGNRAVIDAAIARDGATHMTAAISHPAEAAASFASWLPVLDIDCPAVEPGRPDIAAAPAITGAIALAVQHVQAGLAAAVVTNPIAKELLYRAGFSHPGHTEYLAELSVPAGQPAPRPVMMLVGGGLRVALATIHRPLAAISALLTQDLIVDVGRITHAALRRDFGFASPRIGLCGLNPHAGESGTIGREEIDVVNPAAARLRAEGVDVSDARPGDTIFHEALRGRFDAVIAMYHDQGLIPVKTLDIWGGVNVTLGLPFIRTSPDHGTAYDAAAKGDAKPDSLLAAIDLADRMALARAAAS